MVDDHLYFWGTGSRSNNNAKYQFDSLGIIPGQLWPLQNAFKGWSQKSAKYKKTKLLETLRESSSKFDAKVEKFSESEIDKIYGLFRTHHSKYPSKETAEAVLTAMQVHAESIFGVDSAELQRLFLKQNFVSPLKVLSALWSLRPHPENVEPQIYDVDDELLPSKSTSLGEKTPNPISSYTAIQSEDLKNKFCECVVTDLRSKRRPLIFLEGESYGGKTRTIINFLQEFRASEWESSSKLFVKPTIVNPLGLPVMAGNFKNLSFYSILKRVHGFHYPESLERPDTNIIYSETLWQAIESAAASPAIYVFNCAKLYERDQTESFFAGRGTADLIEMLLEKNSKTRIIVAGSTIKIRRDQTSTFKHVRKAFTIKAKKACIGDYGNFFTPENLKTFKESLAGHPNISSRTEIKASVILSLTSLTKLLGRIDAKLLDAFFFYAANQSEIKSEQAYYSIWWDLIEIFFGDKYTNENFFKAFKLLIASDDAVYINSLHLMLEEWGAKINVIPSKEALNKFIKDVSNITSKRLVTISEGCSLRENESFSFDFINPEFGSKDILIDPPIRLSLQHTFMEKKPEEMRYCWRLLARMARRRARHVRLNSPFPYGSQLSDLDRDVQACMEILSSINITLTATVVPYLTENQPYYSEKKAFDLERVDNSVAVLRYVNNTIFKNEIESKSKHRLSMVLDDDATRLDVVGSLLHGVGRKYRGLSDKPVSENHQVSVSPKHFLEEALPFHIENNFSKREKIQLIETIGVSAFFLDQRVILLAAINQLKALKREDDWNALQSRLNALSRLNGYLNDIDLLRPNGKRGLLTIKTELIRELKVREKLIQRLNAKRGSADQKLCEEVLQRSLLLRCYERLLVILVKDTSRGGFSKEFQNIVARIDENINFLLSNTKDKSGRFGGRLIRNLFIGYLGSPAIDDQPPWKSAELEDGFVKNVLEEYLDLMTSRLAEYSGAERASALSVYSLYQMYLGNFRVALEYAKKARNASHFNKISLAVKIHVTWVYCQAKFLATSKSKADTSNIEREINSFITIAEGHGFLQYANYGRILLTKI